jgi:hypothetical protein
VSFDARTTSLPSTGQEKDDVLELLAMHAGLQPAGPAIAVPDKTIIQP